MQGKRPKKNPKENLRTKKEEVLTKTQRTPASIDKRSKARAEIKKLKKIYEQQLKEIDPSGLATGGRLTRRSTRESRELAKQRERAKEEEARKQLEEQRAQSLANRPQAPAGSRRDRQLHIAFIQMGQGDCTIISTPAGTSILIDCGSTATEAAAEQDYYGRVQRTIYGPKFLAGYNKIDILILTHPDQDHYNMLKYILRNDVQIVTCYHSCAFGLYSQEEMSTWIWNKIGNNAEIFVKEVNILENGTRSFRTNNEKGTNPTTIPIGPQDAQTKIDRLDNRRAIRIIEEDNCKISLLASNVTTRSRVRDDNTANINSVVVLIEAFGKTILICGDATGGTEDFVRTTYPTLQNLDMLQVPHHGSPRTSSTRSFISKMKPQTCIISAPRGSPQHNHPEESVIDDYLNSGRMADVAEHEIFYWESVGDDYQATSRFITKALYITGSYGTVEYTFS